MELGVQVVGPYDHVSQVAAISEAAGIAAVAMADHYLYGADEGQWSQPAYDSLVQMAALARDTSSVELVMLVSPITFRHPAVYAKSITTIDEISGGRLAFGLGTGWHDGEHEVFGFPYPPMAERFAMLDDALGYLRAYIDDPEGGYQGRWWSLAPSDIHPRTRLDLRLVVGGGGTKKTPSLVGRFADEYNLYHHTEDGIAERMEVMRSAALDSGRDPDAVMVTTCYPMVGGADEDEITAVLGHMADERGASVDELRNRFDGRIPMLTWDAHAERLDEFAQLGFSRVYLQGVGSVAWSVENALAALA